MIDVFKSVLSIFPEHGSSKIFAWPEMGLGMCDVASN